LDLKDLQQYFIDRVEATSGKRIHLQSDPKFTGYETIRVATENQPAHVLLYKPAQKAVLPYLVAFQCEFALRTSLAEPGSRFNLVATPSMMGEFVNLMVAHFKNDPTMPAGAVPQFSKLFSDGLCRQLRSMPVSIRIDRMLYEKFPELRVLQRKHIDFQLQGNAHCIGPYAKQSAPNEIIRPNVIMSAAFARFFSSLWDELSIFAPYVEAGYILNAINLLKIHDSIPDEPENDRQLVDAWATYTGLDKWFTTQKR
jgi:hypothetical protein